MDDSSTVAAWTELLDDMAARELEVLDDTIAVADLLADPTLLADETLLEQLGTDSLLDLKLICRHRLAQLDDAA